jgi:hypothetical protein
MCDAAAASPFPEEHMTRAALLASGLLALAAAAPAAEPRYAVLSLLSDQLTIVTHDMGTGSQLDANHRTILKVPDHGLDKREVLALDDALRRAGAEAPVLLFTTDPAIFARQSELLDVQAAPAALLDALKPVLTSARATHLVLASKYRHEAHLSLADGYIGSGQLEGLGFYVDRTYRTKRADTGERGVGFLAPFAYFRLTLIDLGTGQVLRDIPVFASTTRSASRGESGEAWDAMSANDKVRILEALLRQETAREVPRLIAP